MKKYWLDKVGEFLDHKEIQNIEDKDYLRIERDSIVNKIDGDHEEDSYENLRLMLNQEFGKRFNYAFKSDDDLWLEIIEE